MNFKLATIPFLVSLMFSSGAIAAIDCQNLGTAGNSLIGSTESCVATATPPANNYWVSGSLTNNGLISAGDSNSPTTALSLGFFIPGTITAGTLTNGANILANDPALPGVALLLSDSFYFASVQIDAIKNLSTGVISGGAEGIYISQSASQVKLIQNDGQILGLRPSSSYAFAEAIYNAGTIGVAGDAATGLFNGISDGSTTGIIRGNTGVWNEGGTITLLSNSGNITGTNGSAIQNNTGNIGLIVNNAGGVISGSTGYGVDNNGGTIASIVNNGTISGADFAIYNHNNGPTAGVITEITNWGTLTGSLGGINNNNGLSSATIGTLNNAQSGLKYAGVLPTNYNIIIAPTRFGTLDASLGITGSTNFGVSQLSTLTAATYSGVLLGIQSGNIQNYSSIFNTWTNFNSSFKWELVAGSNSTTWNLVVAALAPPPPVATDISGAGNVYQSSSLGTTVNPVFDGGTLQVSSAGSIGNNFTVNANNGVINQNGLASNFTGVISDATAGTPGSMTISNSGSGGSVTFSGANTYIGSTTINSGATLALAGAGSVNSSSGVVNNGTLNITSKTGNVSVSNYTQSSTGTLSMNLAPSNSQQLNVKGVTSLAGGLVLTASAGAYRPGKYTLLTSEGGLTGTFGGLSSNLASITRLGYGLSYDANDVYLVFTPNVADTQQSLVNTASVLQGIYTLQNSVLANSFSYDCQEFGANGICVSVGGRNTAVQAASGLNNTSGLLIAAYRPHQNYRVGAYIDQNLSVNNAGSTVSLGNNTPVIGLFGAWNERLDGTGTEVKVTAAYGQKNTTITRQVVGTSEAGSGSSTLNSQGAQVTAKYGFAVLPQVIVSPYIGMRYTQNNMGGYTEGASSTVTTPLTYSALNTNATTALAGLGASYRFIPKATVFASAGVETDTNTANGTYSASGLAGLTPINFNANPVKTRPTATLGAYYDIEKNQRLGVTGIYRQEPFQAVSTTTVMATYTIGM
jgi:hypothetical protein